MNRVLIVGAGATYGASTAKSAPKPPMLNDFPTILDADWLSLNTSKDGPLMGKTYRALLARTGLHDDVERFLTILFLVEKLSFHVEPDAVFMNQQQLQRALADEPLLR